MLLTSSLNMLLAFLLWIQMFKQIQHH